MLPPRAARLCPADLRLRHMRPFPFVCSLFSLLSIYYFHNFIPVPAGIFVNNNYILPFHNFLCK
ncbi:hypothetical protein D3Z50_02130 [Clostridiaceae bacterium]|nr:hypothetical protein [Clostridiaceae bacterium]